MNRRIALLALLFALAFTALHAAPWVRTYDMGGNTDDGLALDATSDGGFIVSANTNDGADHLWVLKIAADGSVTWERTYDWEKSGFFSRQGIEQTGDGGYIVGTEGDFGASFLIALRLDAAGTLQWDHRYGSVNNELGGVIRETSDGGFIMVGNTPTGIPDTALWVVKLTSTGVVSWQRQYYYDSYHPGFWIEELSIGGYVIASGADDGGWALRIDAAGTILWETECDNSTWIRQCRESSTGNIVVCASTYEYGAGSYDLWVAELDVTDGSTLWEKAYGTIYPDEGVSLWVASDGDLLVAGHYGTDWSTQDVWVLRLDASGNLEWQKRFEGDDTAAIVETTTGEIGVLCVVSNDLCLLKLDANGGVGVCPVLHDTAATAVSGTPVDVITTAIVASYATPDADVTSTVNTPSSTAAEICYPCTGGVTASITGALPSDDECEGTPMTFNGSGSGGTGTLTYQWDFDYTAAFDIMDTGASVGYTYPTPGSYIAALRVVDSCPYPGPQAAMDTLPINIKPGQPEITGPTDSCPGDQVTLDAGAGYLSYLWNPGGMTTQTVDVYPVTTTAYTVDTTAGNGCAGSDDHTVTIHAPTPAVTGPAEICLGDNAILDAGPGWFSHLWSPGGQTTRTIDVSPAGTTLYSVEVTDGYGCPGTDDHTLTVNDAPQSAPSITCPPDVCVGTTYTVSWTAVPDTDNYQLDELCDGLNTMGTLGLSFNRTHWTAGDYCYRVFARNQCGDGPVSTECTVTVFADPNAVITGPTETCRGTPIVLDAGEGYASYLWSPGGWTTRMINVNPTADTNYSVTVTDANGCQGSDNHFVTVHPLPTPTITGPTDVCEGATITLDAGAGYSGYAWTPGGETTQAIDVSPLVNTTYWATVTDGNGCEGADDHFVTVRTAPAAPVITESCWGTDIILDAGAGYASYLWNTGAQTQTLNVGSDTATTYTVTVTNAFGCSAQDDHQAAGPCVLTGDAYEEDDTALTSDTVLRDGETQAHDFLDDAGDWARFSACGGSSYTILTANLGPLADTVLELYDTDAATLLLSDDNGGGGLASRIDWVAPADGIYYVRVFQADLSTGADRTYDLSISGKTSPCAAWSRAFGESAADEAKAAAQTHGGGLMLAGSTASFGAGNGDGWLLRLDPSGGILWETAYGGGQADAFFDVDVTEDGGLILAGWTQSYGAGGFDAWILRLDAAGGILWQRAFGTGNWDQASAVCALSGGAFAAVGHLNYEPWIVKLDAAGAVLWQKRFASGSLKGLCEASDGGLLAVGGYAGAWWALKMDGDGNLLWQKSYGDPGAGEARSVFETADGGFLVGGAEGNLRPDSADGPWVLKLDRAGTLEWQKRYDRVASSSTVTVAPASDGGAVLTGSDPTTGHSYFFKLFADGSVQWQKNYAAVSLLSDTALLADGGFLLGGYTNAYGAGNWDFWALRTYPGGGIGGACPFVSDGSAAAIDTAVAFGVPAEPILSATPAIASPSATVTATAALVDEQCSATCEAVQAQIDSVLPGATVCQGTGQDFSASASGEPPLTYEWDFDYDGITFDVMDTGAAPAYTYPAAGSYSAAVRVTDSCAVPGQDIGEMPVTILANPTVTITGPTDMCEGETIQLDAGAEFSSYSWTPGGETTQTIDVSPAVNTNYIVSVTDAQGCEGSDGHDVTVHPLPTPDISGPTAVCSGNSATLDAGAGYASYLWSPGGETTQTILVTPAVQTVYGVTVTDGFGCQGSDTHTVDVQSLPTAPGSFDATPACGAINLNWADAIGETFYTIERDSGTGFAFLDTAPADAVTYGDTTVSDGVTYDYRMRAENGCGVSADTPVRTAVTATAVYAPPAIVEDAAYCNSLVFDWTDTFGAETATIVERDVNGAGSWAVVQTLPPDSTYYADHDVSPGNTYEYRVTVRNACGDGAASNVLSMAPDCTVTTCESPTFTSVGENISSAPDWVESAAIAWNGSEFGVVWSDPRDAGAWKLIFAKMDADGALVAGSEKVISTDEVSGVPDIAWNGSQFAVVSGGEIGCPFGNQQIVFLTLDADGNATSPTLDITCAEIYGNNFNPRVHWNGSTWGVVWESWTWGDEEVLFQRLDTSAVPQHAQPLQISNSGPGTWSGLPDITSIAGEWFIVWSEDTATQSEIFYSRRNADGTEVNTAQLTNDANLNHGARVSASDSVLGLIYIQNNDPQFRTFNPDGSWDSSLQQLGTSPDCRATEIKSTGAEWAMAWQMAAVYDDPPEIWFRRADSTGTLQGSSTNVTNNFWDSANPRLAWGGDRWGLAYTENPLWMNNNAHGAVAMCSTDFPPSAPRDLTADAYCSALVLQWIDTASNEDEFILERSDGGGPYNPIATLPADTYGFLDTNVAFGTVYTYRVSASNTFGSNTSGTAAAEPLDCPIEDLFINNMNVNPDGTIYFAWSGIDWQEFVDVYRGGLNPAFTYNHDTQVECSYDAQTGFFTTLTDQVTSQGAYYYIIAPKTTGGNLYGRDSGGTDRPASASPCP